MYRPAVATILVLAFLVPPDCHADLVSDAQSTINKLNPINIALKGLIGEAAEALDSKLQQRLQQIQGIVELAISELDQVAKNRIDQADKHVKEDIDKLNDVVKGSLLQFSSLVGKHIKDLNQDMLQRIDQFNFGTANTIASVSFLNTIPLIKTDSTGISIFKQAGESTTLYIVGSGLKKSKDTPNAYLSGQTVKADHSTAWGLLRDGISVNVPNASMGLLEITIPNSVIPDEYGPFHFSLALKLREGSSWIGWPVYSEQSVPLHICGRLPKFKAVLTVWASGKHNVRSRQPLASLIHAGCAKGNTHDHGLVCLPDRPPAGWDFDTASPDYGIVWGTTSQVGYTSITHGGTGNRCVDCYCDGSQGDAHCNLQAVEMKLLKVEDLDVCTSKWKSDPIALTYGKLVQTNVHGQVIAAGGSGNQGCDELRGQYNPAPHATVEIIDDKGKVLETKDLREEIEASALSDAATFTLHSSGLVDMRLEPRCVWSQVPSSK